MGDSDEDNKTLDEDSEIESPQTPHDITVGQEDINKEKAILNAAECEAVANELDIFPIIEESPKKKNLFRSFTLKPSRDGRKSSLGQKIEKLRNNFSRRSVSVDECATDNFPNTTEIASPNTDTECEVSKVDRYLEKALSSNPIDSRAGKTHLLCLC